MSGGSFNYLCHKELSDFFDYGINNGDWDRMLDELDVLSPIAAAEMRKIRTSSEEFERLHNERWRKLQSVLHAVEWWRSNDWGKDQVDEVIAKYELETDNG